VIFVVTTLVSQSLKSSESEYDIRKAFGVGVEFVGVGVESESKIRDFAHLYCGLEKHCVLVDVLLYYFATPYKLCREKCSRLKMFSVLLDVIIKY